MKFKIGLILVVVFSVFYACSDDLNNMLEVSDQELDSHVKVIATDTLTLKFSTFKFDSLVTSNASRILVGRYNDPYFGRIKASSFFELNPKNYTIANEGVYDSICMVLKYDDYYINDTLKPQTFYVKRLYQTVKPPKEETNFYTTSTLETFQESLGSKTFYPRPLSENDSLLIRLSDDFGQELFTKIQDDAINNIDEFLDYFKGVKIESNIDDDSSVMGFDKDSTYMRVYYSTIELGEVITNYFDLGINQSRFFNQVVSDRSNTNLVSLVHQENTIQASDADNRSFIQSGVGIVTRIDIPYLKSIYSFDGNETVLSARLYIFPQQGTFTKYTPLPQSFKAYQVDKKNNIVGQLYGVESNGLEATLVEADDEFNIYYYALDLTVYIESILQSKYEDGSGFILKQESINETLDRVIFNTHKNTEYKTFLELTLVTYE